MKITLRAIAFLVGLLPALALAQQFPVVADHTVIGRIGTGTGSGPSSAISFTQLLRGMNATPASTKIGDIVTWTNTVGSQFGDSGGSIPSNPVVHPSSGNLLCSQGHAAWWIDQNLCSTADTWNWTSTDPSALFQATIGGSVTTGDRVSLTFTFGSGACASGCTVGYTAVGGDTVTKIAQGLACAIANNANLFNLNGSSCTGGSVSYTSTGVGGYPGSQLVGFIPAPTNGILYFDFNSTISIAVTSAVSGSATETVTLANSNCGTVCSNAWDNNPVLATSRFVSGIAPPANSQIFALDATSNDSSSLTAINRIYGTFSHLVLNSTANSLSSRWALLTTNSSGSINQGIYVGAGLYSPSRTDKGNNTANFSQLWTADVDEISRSSTTWVFNATTNDAIQFLSGTFSAQINNGGLALDIGSSGSITTERLGVAGTSTGQLILCGSISNCGTITPQNAAGSSPVWTLPNATGTFAISASSPLALNTTTGALSISNIPNSALTNPATTVAGQTCTLGSTCGLSSFTNSLSGAVNLVTSGVYVDGPSVAQGTTGTWFASGSVLVTPNAAGNIVTCKLWDGTTRIASGGFPIASTSGGMISLSGQLASPAANIRISCANQSANGGTIAATDGVDGNTASTLTAIRIN